MPAAFSVVGAASTPTGTGALTSNQGFHNTANGAFALALNTVGSGNTATGANALQNTTGNDNIGINHGRERRVAVMIDSAGQLGTVSSSRRVKQDIEDMGEASQGLMKLRPVTFRYNASLDPTGSRQYGLVAEEVADAFPDLAVLDRNGRPEIVRYYVLVPMLLNELQRDRKTIADLSARLERLEALMSESAR